MNTTFSKAQIEQWLSEIPDPEIPVITIVELGMVRDVQVENGNEVTVWVTPTYSGCPAVDMINMQIRMALMSRGVKTLHLKEQLDPAWTTDWISEEGKQKMKEYGISPPKRKSKNSLDLFEEEHAECPRCSSHNTEIISQFGSTSCKALHRCLDCKEPFEHFKCH